MNITKKPLCLLKYTTIIYYIYTDIQAKFTLPVQYMNNIFTMYLVSIFTLIKSKIHFANVNIYIM